MKYHTTVNVVLHHQLTLLTVRSATPLMCMQLYSSLYMKCHNTSVHRNDV